MSLVLAVDPGDAETVDLKERGIVYLNNPDQFDLHAMQRAGSEGVTPQRLLRSASERRVRKTDGGAIINSGGNAAGGLTSKSSDKNNNAASTNGENITGDPPPQTSSKLRRTRSELHRPGPPNVLERIKEFERQASKYTYKIFILKLFLISNTVI